MEGFTEEEVGFSESDMGEGFSEEEVGFSEADLGEPSQLDTLKQAQASKPFSQQLAEYNPTPVPETAGEQLLRSTKNVGVGDKAFGAGIARGAVLPEALGVAGNVISEDIKSLAMTGKPLTAAQRQQAGESVPESMTLAQEAAPIQGTLGEIGGSLLPIPGPEGIASVTGMGTALLGRGAQAAKRLPTTLSKASADLGVMFSDDATRAAAKDTAALEGLRQSEIPFRDLRGTAVAESRPIMSSAERRVGEIETEAATKAKDAQTKLSDEIFRVRQDMQRASESAKSARDAEKLELMALRKNAVSSSKAAKEATAALEELQERVISSAGKQAEKDVAEALSKSEASRKQIGQARDEWLNSDEMLTPASSTISHQLSTITDTIKNDPMFAAYRTTGAEELKVLEKYADQFASGNPALKKEVAEALIDLRGKIDDTIPYQSLDRNATRALKERSRTIVKGALHDIDPKFEQFDHAFYENYQAARALKAEATKKGFNVETLRPEAQPSISKIQRSSPALETALRQTGVESEALRTLKQGATPELEAGRRVQDLARQQAEQSKGAYTSRRDTLTPEEDVNVGRREQVRQLAAERRAITPEISPEQKPMYDKIKEILPKETEIKGKTLAEDDMVALAKRLSDAGVAATDSRAGAAIKAYADAPEYIKDLLRKAKTPEEETTATKVFKRMVDFATRVPFAGDLIAAKAQPVVVLENLAKANKKVADAIQAAAQKGVAPGKVQKIVDKYGDTVMARILINRLAEKGDEE